MKLLLLSLLCLFSFFMGAVVGVNVFPPKEKLLVGPTDRPFTCLPRTLTNLKDFDSIRVYPDGHFVGWMHSTGSSLSLKGYIRNDTLLINTFTK